MTQPATDTPRTQAHSSAATASRPSLSVVAINGSPYRPSRTSVLLQTLLSSLETALETALDASVTRAGGTPLPIDSQIIEFADIAQDVGGALSRKALSARAEAALQAIESADLLIVGTPVFRGSLPGLLKHLFDLVHLEPFVDKPVLFAATGGSDRHALVIDHQLRPLFSFFQSLTLPIGVYASQADFADYRITSELLQSRIALAVERALPVLDTVHARKAAAVKGGSGEPVAAGNETKAGTATTGAAAVRAPDAQPA